MDPLKGSASADGDQAPDDPQEVPQDPGQGAQDEQQQEPEYLTTDHLQKLGIITQQDLQKTLQRFGSQLVQRIGVSTDQRIRNQIAAYNQAVALQAQAGSPVSPEVQQAARQKIIQNAYLEDQQPQPGQPGQAQQQQQAQDDAWPRYLASQIETVFQQSGIQVVEGDPEYQVIEQAWNDPNGSAAALVMATMKAVEAKKARVASKSSQARARAGVGGGKPTLPGDISNITDPDELFAIAEKQIRGRR